ncbi:probable outer membrane receptor for iron transport [Cytophaga hutchinsonii ATCC 33406]|uniref:Probable outer membrane receptor for iron transport n=2 Tax=Cytophaga hutchinsonii TaxID=985 RepID=A0A6N4SMI9_CYTH3|nr:probable outer membrane receptor for iron transport [Cytophaga hutchinsonii ATCC 33406]
MITMFKSNTPFLHITNKIGTVTTLSKLIGVILFLHIQTIAFGQNGPYTIQGTIVDSTTNEPVIGAIVKRADGYVGTQTNIDGFFLIEYSGTLPVTLVVNYTGYANQSFVVTEENVGQRLTIPIHVDVNASEVITISSRRRDETAQDVPIPISVVGGARVEDAGAFNVNRIKEIVPSVQLYSSNPRNTGLNIRGLGSPFGLTNDGLDPGVGYYVDGVYYARPAATTLDFIDVERVEVLRGPQGTLFGKNTSNGAFNIVSRAPSFKTGGVFESSFGNFGFIQTKLSVTGPINQKLAARLSFSGTQRDGLIYNQTADQYTNDINNLGFRASLLYNATKKVKITFIADATRQRPNGYAQVAAGVVTTKRSAYRQFNAIAADLNYSLPTLNAFDRTIDQNTNTRSGNDLGGASVNIDAKIGKGTLTSTTAWRYWNWDPSNDRDFTGLDALRLSQNPSKHQQVSQEFRYAGNFSERLSGVAGIFAIGQTITTTGTEQAGADQWRFSRTSNTPPQTLMTSDLIDGLTQHTKSTLNTFSGAIFGQLDWAVIKNRLHVLPGLRYNYDYKDADYNRTVDGGKQTADPAEISLKNSVYSAQYFHTKATNTNLSGNLTVSYVVRNNINVYATYSNAYKPVGVNIAGLPTTSTGEADLSLATVKPEYTTNYEFGIKTSPTKNSVLNFAAFDTEVKDYQANVQSPQLGVNRGYLANAEHVKVWGLELDGNTKVGKYLTLNAAVSYTEGIYKKFTNAPLPLEETGAAVSFKDISGGSLPGISKWASSIGAEIALPGKFFTNEGKYFFAVDNFNRSKFSSSPSPSQYLNIDGYSLFNARLGFRATKGLTVFVWSRNVFNKNYYEQLLPAAGNTGLYAGVLGDQRTFGTTLRYAF